MTTSIRDYSTPNANKSMLHNTVDFRAARYLLYDMLCLEARVEVYIFNETLNTFQKVLNIQATVNCFKKRN